MTPLEIRLATPADIPAIQEIFLEYAQSVGNDICFRTFQKEVDSLPGPYAPPNGALLVAVTPGTIVACVALRQLSPTSCEMKRLYVRPAFRRQGLGRDLTHHIIAHARTLGYQTLHLDTLPEMTAAIALYRTLGFLPILRYGDNPPNALCFQKVLKST